VDFGLRIEESSDCFSIRIPQSEIRNNVIETPKRGRGAKCPDRFMPKRLIFLAQIFRE
jgi:hypothetical protein